MKMVLSDYTVIEQIESIILSRDTVILRYHYENKYHRERVRIGEIRSIEEDD